MQSWLAFAVQKCEEVTTLARALSEPQAADVQAALEQSRAVQASRAASPRIHRPEVQARLAAIQPGDSQRQSAFAERIGLQRAGLSAGAFAYTTMVFPPQTPA